MSDDSVMAALTRLEAGMGTLRSDVGTLKSDVGTLKSDVGTLKSDVGTLKSDVGTLKNDVHTLRGDLRTGLADMAERHEKLAADQADTRARLGEQLERLLNSLTDIRADISVNYGAAEAMKRANDNTREQVRLLDEQVSIMYRQLKRLEEKVRGLTGDP